MMGATSRMWITITSGLYNTSNAWVKIALNFSCKLLVSTFRQVCDSRSAWTAFNYANRFRYLEHGMPELDGLPIFRSSPLLNERWRTAFTAITISTVTRDTIYFHNLIKDLPFLRTNLPGTENATGFPLKTKSTVTKLGSENTTAKHHLSTRWVTAMASWAAPVLNTVFAVLSRQKFYHTLEYE